MSSNDAAINKAADLAWVCGVLTTALTSVALVLAWKAPWTSQRLDTAIGLYGAACWLALIGLCAALRAHFTGRGSPVMFWINLAPAILPAVVIGLARFYAA